MTNHDDLENRLERVYQEYFNTVSIQVATYELFSMEFPIAILNEIRYLFTHIARYEVAKKEDTDRGRQEAGNSIVAAERHLKRIILDGYKNMCICYSDYHNEFKRRYRNVELALVSNGEFLKALSHLEENAASSYLNARTVESLNKDIYDTYESFQKAYEDNRKLHNYVKRNLENIEIVRHRATKDTLFKYGGLAIGLLGLILTIISFIN